MKILQLIQKKQLRGAEVFAAQMSEQLQKLGHHVMIVALLDGNEQLPFSGEVVCLDININNRMFDIKAWKKLNQIIKKFNPDIIQANAGDTLKYAVFSKLLFRWENPLLFRNASMVSNYTQSALARKLVGFLFKHVDRFLSVSHFTKKDLIENFNISEPKINVVPVGVELKSYHKLEAFNNGQINLVHVGGFTFEKNHEGLLDIFKKVLETYPMLKLWLVGDGPLRKKIEEKAISMDIREQIEFVGFVNNPLDYIHSARILLLPSVIEGLPGVILESFYCQTPVVAYDVGGISELVVNNKTGKILTARNEQGFADAVLDLLSADDVFLHQLKSNAKEKVMSAYTNISIAQQLEKIYEEIVK